MFILKQKHRFSSRIKKGSRLVIVIDGYNFLKLITGKTFIDASTMRYWYQKFQSYIQINHKNQIMLVLDAGPEVFMTSEKNGRLEVVYAGQSRTADDYIITWASQHKNKDLLVVSSDREIKNYCWQIGVVAINSQEFYRCFLQAFDFKKNDRIYVDQVAYKTNKNQHENPYLDELMSQFDHESALTKMKDEYNSEIKETFGDKVSKKNRLIIKQLNKI